MRWFIIIGFIDLLGLYFAHATTAKCFIERSYGCWLYRPPLPTHHRACAGCDEGLLTPHKHDDIVIFEYAMALFSRWATRNFGFQATNIFSGYLMMAESPLDDWRWCRWILLIIGFRLPRYDDLSFIDNTDAKALAAPATQNAFIAAYRYYDGMI